MCPPGGRKCYDRPLITCLAAVSGKAAALRITIFRIKFVHTLIFWILSLCVLYTVYSALMGRIDTWTWVALGLVLAESVTLAAAGWTCPLTILAERQGALKGSVTDIFLPKWFADRIFPVCGTLWVGAVVVIAVRMLL